MPAAEEFVVRLAVWMPFSRAMEMARAALRITVPKETVHRLLLSAGRALDAAEEAATAYLYEALPEPPVAAVEHQQISIDGAFVPLIGEWAEVKTMAIGAVIEGKDGPKATDLTYHSRLADFATFARSATLETHRRGTNRARKVTAVADGSEWIQEVEAIQCPTATRVLDWAHSSSYINRAAQALFASPGEAADWRSEQLRTLMYGAPEDVLRALCEGLTRCAAGSDEEAAVATSLGYLAKRHDQIQYRRFREEGLPIGSGIVESANKLVVEARLKGAGMRWSRATVNPMLALRTADCSDRWAATWPRLERYRERTAAEAARARHDAKHPPPPPPKRKRRSFRDFKLRRSPGRPKL